MSNIPFPSSIHTGFSRVKNGFFSFIDKHPLPSFLIFLAILILVAVVGNRLRTPVLSTTVITPPAKIVQTYQLDGAPSISIQAKIEKSGTITLVAQSPGVVQQIRKKEGQTVQRGTTLISLSTSYQGGNVASLGRQIAQKNYQYQVDNFDAQNDLINKQRDVAQKGNTLASELRSISRQSQDDTKNLINTNTDLLNSINSQLVATTAVDSNPATNQSILPLQQAKSGVESALANLKSGQRALEYQAADDKLPAQLSEAQRDLAVKQLDLQQKMLVLGKDIAGLTLSIAQVSESSMYPASPCAGTVERIYVKVGQSVQPGTVLASIKANDNQATAVALVSQQIAQTISPVQPTQFMINGEKVTVIPSYISKEPTDGTLFSVIYHLPNQYSSYVTNNSWISITVPLGYQTANISSSIPLDAVYQTQSESYVYVVGTNSQGSASAMVKKVSLGQVFGEYIEVKSGLEKQDKVITNRNVLDGDFVQIK